MNKYNVSFVKSSLMTFKGTMNETVTRIIELMESKCSCYELHETTEVKNELNGRYEHP